MNNLNNLISKLNQINGFQDKLKNDSSTVFEKVLQNNPNYAKTKPIIDILKNKNSSNPLQTILQNGMNFNQSQNYNNKKTAQAQTQTVFHKHIGLNPIAQFASKEIIYSLTKYLAKFSR